MAFIQSKVGEEKDQRKVVGKISKIDGLGITSVSHAKSHWLAHGWKFSFRQKSNMEVQSGRTKKASH